MMDGADQWPVCSGRTDTTAAEILYDVSMGALWRWVGTEAPDPGAFLAELDTVVELVIRGLATSSTDPGPAR